MRTRLVALTLTMILIFPAVTNSQTPTATTQAATILNQSLAAFGGSTTVSDITLTGTAERIAGSDDETGTATYKALSTANRLDLNLSGGSRSEIRGISSDGPTGTWIGPDGSTHNIATQNLMSDPGFFPLFTLANLNSSANNLFTYVGLESRNGASVIHLSGSQQFPTSPTTVAAFMQHLTRVEIYLDSKSFLPVSYLFTMHPDNDAGFDIPAEVRYSNYQTIGGLQIPFHIQKLVNNTLVLDLQIQSASINSGMTAAQLGAL